MHKMVMVLKPGNLDFSIRLLNQHEKWAISILLKIGTSNALGRQGKINAKKRSPLCTWYKLSKTLIQKTSISGMNNVL